MRACEPVIQTHCHVSLRNVLSHRLFLFFWSKLVEKCPEFLAQLHQKKRRVALVPKQKYFRLRKKKMMSHELMKCLYCVQN